MGAEVGERPASRPVPAAEHEGEGIHREGPGFSGPRGKEEPARIVRRPQVDEGGTEEGTSAVVEIRSDGSPRILVERDQERLGALGTPEHDDGAVEVDVRDPQEPDRRVAGRRRHEDRHDRPVAQIERPVSEAAALQGLQVSERRALGGGLLGWQERVERGPSARPAERVDPENALVDEPDRQ